MPLYLSMPGLFETTKGLLVISCLRISIPCESLDKVNKTLLNHLRNDLGLDIKTVDVSEDHPTFGSARDPLSAHLNIVFKDWDKLLEYVLDIEPLVETVEKARKAKKSSHLLDVSPEETLKYGFPDIWDKP